MAGVKPAVGPSIKIGGKYFILSGSEYTGATQYYIYCLFRHFVDNDYLNRYIIIGYALVAIAFSYLLTKELLNKKSAILIALLLTFSPSFLFYSRGYKGVIFLRTVFASGILYFFYKWYKTQKWRYFYIGSFLVGLGITTRLELAWFPITALLYGIIFQRPLIKELLFKTRGWMNLLISEFLLLLGLAPLILYNFGTKLGTLQRILRNVGTTQYGHSNLTFINNFERRIHNLLTLLDGGNFWETGAEYHNYLMSGTFIISTAILIYLLARRILTKKERDRIISLFFFIITMLALSTFSVTRASNPMHLLVLIPLPYLIIIEVLNRIPSKKLLLLIIVVLLSSDIYVDILYYQKLNETHGVGVFSSRIYELSDYLVLKTKEGKTIVYLDWAFRNSVAAISEGEVKSIDSFGYSKVLPEEYKNRWRKLIKNPDNLYVFHGPKKTIFKGRFEAFSEVVAEQNKKLIMEKEFYEYDNKTPLYRIYSLRPQ